MDEQARQDAAALRHALDEALDRLVDAEREVARAAARRMRALDDVRTLHEQSRSSRSTLASGVVFRTSDDLDSRSLRAEVATAIRVGEREAESSLAEARVLIHELPATWNGFLDGSLSDRHVRIAVDETSGLDPDDRRNLDQRIAALGQQHNPARFRQQVRRARERLAPESKAERTRSALADRRTWFEPGRDGVADLTIRGPAVQLAAVDDRLRTMASAQQNAPGEARTAGQLQADAAVALLLGTAGDGVPDPNWAPNVFAIRPTVHLTVPALALLDPRPSAGTAEMVELAELDGYGPIDPGTAARWMAVAPSLTRIVVHPITGAMLALDRTKYRPTDDLRAWLRARDGTCRFPGCGAVARRCEIDHTAEWCADGGATNDDNLCCLCIGHHTLKTSTAWRSRQSSGGIVEWISPLDREYRTYPDRATGVPPPDRVHRPPLRLSVNSAEVPAAHGTIDARDMLDRDIEEFWRHEAAA